MKREYKVGDEVWVPQNLGDRMRPIKLVIFAVQVTDYGTKKTTVYYNSNGEQIQTEVFPTIEKCEKAINIIERYKKEINESMSALLAENETQLVDAVGRKML